MIKILKNILLIKKINFEKYENKDVILYDNSFSKIFEKMISKENFIILFTRYEYLNLRIILKLLFTLRLNSLNYFLEIIKEINPKIVVTFTDNDEKFWLLKEKINNPKIKFIIIQNGWRTNIFENINKKSKNYCLDDMFFFNKNISNLYSRFIKGNTHYLGSFINNYFNPDTEVKKSEKKSILFISQINPYKNHQEEFLIRIKKKNFSWKQFYEADFIVLKFLNDYCYKKNIVLNIMGRNYRNRFNEKNMFRKFLGHDNFNYIENRGDFSQYSTILNFDLLIYLDSTFGYEAISRKIKTCAFTIRGNVLGLDDDEFKFGWPAILENTGFFWTNQKNTETFEKIIDRVNSISQNEWISITNVLRDELMIYSKKNKIFSDYLKENAIKTNFGY